MAAAAAPTDALSQAQTQITAQKAATLAAIAAAGTQGQQAYQAAQASNASQKTQALNGMLSNLGGMGAPAQFTAAEDTRLSQPYDLAAANLTQQGAARGTFLSNLGATSGAYFDQTNAAVPAMRAAANNALLVAQQKQAQADQAASLALQTKQLDLQIAQQNAAKANAPQTLGQTISGLGGDTQAGNALLGMGANQNNDAYNYSQQMAQGATPGSPADFGAVDRQNNAAYESGAAQGNFNNVPGLSAASQAALAPAQGRALSGFAQAGGAQVGIPGPVAQSLYDNTPEVKAAAAEQAKATAAAATPAGIRLTQPYQDATTRFRTGLAAIKDPKNPPQFDITTGRGVGPNDKIAPTDKIRPMTVDDLKSALTNTFGFDVMSLVLADQRHLAGATPGF